MHSNDLTKKDIDKIRENITNDFAQKSSPYDTMLDLDDEISVFGDEIEIRSQFERDRDRIIYSTAFRRLEHKAQVYSHEKGDHYRTRLTHTIEVMQIARGIAKNLGLNEELTEAIALGHDIGHTPFGHAGEEVLDDIMRGNDDLGGKLKYKLNFGGFKHNFHSIKILDVIERKYENEKGLNLSWQVLDGILKHTKIKKTKKNWHLNRFIKNKKFFEDLVPPETFLKNPYNLGPNKPDILDSSIMNSRPNITHSLTLEGQVVNIADEIAQRQHDLDDGLRDIELRMNELDVLLHTENIIDTVLEEILMKKIVLELEDDIFYPITFLLEGMNEEIIDSFRIPLLMPAENFNEQLKVAFPFFIVNLILEEYYDYLDKDIKLLLDLKGFIHKSEVKKDDFKWKNRIRNVTSYFIHDVSYNTMKNIKEGNCAFLKNNKYKRNENLEYLRSMNEIIESEVETDDRLFNERNYAISKCVCFSETAEKLDKKIEQFIDNRIINSYNVNRFDGKAKYIIKQLFKAYYENPKQMNKNQLNYLSNLINENIENYYELTFRDGAKIRDIKFDSEDPGFILNLEDLDKLIDLLKLEIRLECLNDPDINFLKDPCENLDFLTDIGGNTEKIHKKSNYLDDEAFNILIFDEILQKINEMDKANILNEEKAKREKILFIKCLIENHYAYLSVICDYIAGMTDNYAKEEYEKLYLV